jgi:hypothetical protein
MAPTADQKLFDSIPYSVKPREIATRDKNLTREEWDRLNREARQRAEVEALTAEAKKLEADAKRTAEPRRRLAEALAAEVEVEKLSREQRQLLDEIERAENAHYSFGRRRDEKRIAELKSRAAGLGAAIKDAQGRARCSALDVLRREEARARKLGLSKEKVQKILAGVRRRLDLD